MLQASVEVRAPDELAAFFSPRAVAIFGASRDRHKIGSEILHNLIASGFRGPIVPIHPEAAEIQGRPAFRAIAEVPHDIDLAMVVVPAPAVEHVVDECLATQADDVAAAIATAAHEGPHKPVAGVFMPSATRRRDCWCSGW